jgi:YD repeat-containing protein
VTYPAGTGNAGNAGNATTGTIGRDRDGATASLASKRSDGTPLASDAVTRSQAGKVVDQLIDGADADPAGRNFSYDGAGRLCEIRRSDGTTVPGASRRGQGHIDRITQNARPTGSGGAHTCRSPVPSTAGRRLGRRRAPSI